MEVFSSDVLSVGRNHMLILGNPDYQDNSFVKCSNILTKSHHTFEDIFLLKFCTDVISVLITPGKSKLIDFISEKAKETAKSHDKSLKIFISKADYFDEELVKYGDIFDENWKGPDFGGILKLDKTFRHPMKSERSSNENINSMPHTALRLENLQIYTDLSSEFITLAHESKYEKHSIIFHINESYPCNFREKSEPVKNITLDRQIGHHNIHDHLISGDKPSDSEIPRQDFSDCQTPRLYDDNIIRGCNFFDSKYDYIFENLSRRESIGISPTPDEIILLNQKFENLSELVVSLMDSQKENKSKISLCSICMDEKSSIAFVKCGHLCLCRNCRNNVEMCPICRTVGNTIEIYLC